MIRTAISSILVVVGTTLTPAFAQIYADIKADAGTFNYRAMSYPNNSAYVANYSEASQSLRIYEHGSWHARPYASQEVVYNGTKSICFHAVGAHDNASVPDRSELVVSQNADSTAISFGKRRYLQYKLYIHPNSATPQYFTILTQAWQNVGTEVAYSPPFAVSVRENSGPNPVLDFHTRNDSNPTTLSPPTTIWSKPILKGVWYKISVQLQPAYMASGLPGQIAIWVDKPIASTPDVVWTGDWGFRPSTTPFIGNTFDVRVGTYRRKQPGQFISFFDDIRYGATGAAVDY